MASNSKFKLAILGIILALLIAACEQLDGLGLDPQILSFTATPSGSVEAGDDVTLNWNIVGGAEDLAVTLTPGDVSLEKTGSYVVTPGETTEYVLSAGSEGKLATKTLTVEVAGTENPSEPEQPGGGDEGEEPEDVRELSFYPSKFDVGETTSVRLNSDASDLTNCFVSVNGSEPFEQPCKEDAEDFSLNIDITPSSVGTKNVEIRALKRDGSYALLKGSFEVVSLPRTQVNLSTRANTPVKFDLDELVADKDVPSGGYVDVDQGSSGNLTLDYIYPGPIGGPCCYSIGKGLYIPNESFTGTDTLTFAIVDSDDTSVRLAYIDMTITVTEDTTDDNAPCDARIISIKDIILRTAVHGALGVDFNDDVTCAQIGTIKELDASGITTRNNLYRSRVTDISSLEYAVSLENLSLRGADLSDISVLIDLPWAGSNDTVDLSDTINIPAEQIEALKQKVENVIQ